MEHRMALFGGKARGHVVLVTVHEGRKEDSFVAP